jgi:phosphoribosylformylglycinamidine cyclo-ligase
MRRAKHRWIPRHRFGLQPAVRPLLFNSGVSSAAEAVAGLVSVLGTIDPGRASRSVVGSGHYASVVAIDDRTGIAVCTDGVGTKVIVAMQAGRFDTIGVDCVAMNVNDLICVGAEPIAMVDYLAVEQPDVEMLRAIGEGLKRGAELAGVEIPGGELAELPELIRGHPSPHGFDLAGAAFGTVALDRMITGEAVQPGDAVIALPSSGIHSNGLTLARRTLIEKGGRSLDDVAEELGRSLADELLEPTEIYVRAVLELINSPIEVHGLAHITGDGLLNLLRLNDEAGYELDPLPAPPPVFKLIETVGGLSPAQMYREFNMGIGFCCVVPKPDAQRALALLGGHYPAASQIGQVTADAGVISLPSVGITGRKEGFE